MNEPFFSVIIPTFNRPVELKRAVHSVLAQTFHDYEIIIVDNGNIPAEDIYSNCKVKIVKEQRLGANYARNTGVSIAKGEFVCFLDDDDEYLASHLTTLHNLIVSKKHKLGLYRTLTRIESPAGELKDQEFSPCPTQKERLEFAMRYLVFMASVSLPKEIALKYAFDPSITIAQDYHLWLRVLADYPLLESDQFTTIYHYSSVSTSRQSKRKYYEYVNVYKTLFNTESIGSQITSRTKRDRIFRYYFWLLSEFKRELSLSEFLNVISNIIYYKPQMLFGKALYAAILRKVERGNNPMNL